MSSLAPPISIHLTRQQLHWLDGRRRCSRLSRSAALRSAIDELIQQEQATGFSSSPAKRAAAPRQLVLPGSASSSAEG